jgi:hypothetical protein
MCSVRSRSSGRWTHSLAVFRDSNVGEPGWVLGACTDASMRRWVDDSAKSRVALNDPDIFPLSPSMTMAYPATGFRSN